MWVYVGSEQLNSTCEGLISSYLHTNTGREGKVGKWEWAVICGGLERVVLMFVSLCVCVSACLHSNLISCVVSVQTDAAPGSVYDSGCPNLWKQWVVSNQSEPWGFKPANYNV